MNERLKQVSTVLNMKLAELYQSNNITDDY